MTAWLAEFYYGIVDYACANPWIIGVALALAGVAVATAIWDARR